MRPYRHARSSAGASRPWTDDLAVHEFMDATKFACADRRHRIVLHHVDLGAEIVAWAFPARTDAVELVRSHVREDLGHHVRLADWFEHVDVERLPVPIARRVRGGTDGLASLVCSGLPSTDPQIVREVCRFLFRPCAFVNGEPLRALPVLMNAAGPMIVRHVFGPPREAADGTVVDHALIAEAAIHTAFGRISDLHEVVRCVTGEPVARRDADASMKRRDDDA